MPELPEVEIIKRSLKKKIKFKKIIKVTIRNRNLRFKLQKNFGKFLKNRFVKEVSRISKYLILEFYNQKYCIIHLGMSGTIHLISKKKQNKFTNLSFYQSRTLPEKHNHVELLFSNFKIIYNDPRRFGYFKIINSQSELKEFFNRIGPEAISKDFNLDYLKKKLINKTKELKVGPGNKEATTVTPLISDTQLKRVSNYCKSGVQSGANVLVGGDIHENTEGNYFAPTIFDNVDGIAAKVVAL